MKKTLKKALAVVLTLMTVMTCFAGMTAFAASFSSGDWTFQTTADNKVTVIAYIGAGGEAVIPETVSQSGTNYTVTAIADNVGRGVNTVTALTVPSGVATIGKEVFSGATALKTVTLRSEAQITLAENAFAQCGALTSVLFNGSLNLGTGAFVNSAASLVFTYQLDSLYQSQAAAETELAACFGTGTWTWFTDTDGSKYARWNGSYAGKPVRTTALNMSNDATAPVGSIQIGSNKWSTLLEASKITYEARMTSESTAKLTVSDPGEGASGVKLVSYMFSENPINNPSSSALTAWTDIGIGDFVKQTDGTLVYNQPLPNDAKLVMYVRITDNAGNCTYINTNGLIIDTVAPTVKLTNTTAEPDVVYTTALYGSAVTFTDTYNTAVSFKVTAEDMGGIASASYLAVKTAFADEKALKAATGWKALSSSDWKTAGASFVVGSNNENRVVYVKVTDAAGNVSFVSSNGFKAKDTQGPRIVGATYRAGKREEITFENGATFNTNAMVYLFASDDVAVTSFTCKKNSEKAASIANGDFVKQSGTYVITATDSSGNKTTVTLVLNITDKEKPTATITGVVNGAKTDTKAVNGQKYTYNYPVTIKAADNVRIGYAYVSYTGSDGKTVYDVSISGATEPFTLSENRAYTVVLFDPAGNQFLFNVTINESPHSVKEVAVDTGNTTDKTVVSCMGGSFTAKVTGTSIYNKLAIFNGTERVGDIILIGSNTEPLNEVTIPSGTFTIPANNTDKPIEYIIRCYDASADSKDITATAGTQVGKLSAAAKVNTISVEPTSLTFTSAAGTKSLTPKANCTYQVSTGAGDSGWMTLSQAKGEKGEVLINVTVTKNTGIDRTGTVIFAERDNTNNKVIVTVTQEGVGIDVARLQGSDRINTAVEISKTGWKTSTTAIIANGYAFADALAGVPLSKAAGAPILLTGNGLAGLETAVLDELTRLGVKTVYILGGESVVSANIAAALTGKSITVTRLSGATRYETAVAIAKELSVLTKKSFTRLYFANAANYPDALAIGSVAGIEGNPILYLPNKGKIDKATSDYVTSTGCKSSVILGGTAAVSAEGEKSVKALGLTADRISGSDRYATALAISKTFAPIYTGKSIAVATGTNFPDALAGGAFAAQQGIPVLLVSDKTYSNAAAYIKSLSATKLFVFGGTSAVSDSVVVKLAVG